MSRSYEFHSPLPPEQLPCIELLPVKRTLKYYKKFLF